MEVNVLNLANFNWREFMQDFKLQRILIWEWNWTLHKCISPCALSLHFPLLPTTNFHISLKGAPEGSPTRQKIILRACKGKARPCGTSRLHSTCTPNIALDTILNTILIQNSVPQSSMALTPRKLTTVYEYMICCLKTYF